MGVAASADKVAKSAKEDAEIVDGGSGECK